MIAVFTALVIVFVSVIIVRIAAVGLALTGVSKDLAQFQAMSAFTRSGFTTKESEDIVNHPLRRRIVMHLMLVGNVGSVAAISSVVATLLNSQDTGRLFDSTSARMLLLAGGIGLLGLVASSRQLEQVMWRLNTWALQHWTTLDVLDYTSLLRLAHNYVVSEVSIGSDDWLAGRSLAELALASEGVLVLGIERADGPYLGAPRGETRVHSGDSLILYGRQETLVSLHSRSAGIGGNLNHVMAVTRQLDMLEQQDLADPDDENQATP